jgi:ketosteroid isomerase-like protein
MNSETIKTEVLDASRKWVESFNHGNTKACADTYLEDAVMEARPMGRFDGRKAIFGFWRGFVNSTNATNLQYSDINIDVVAENNAVLSAKWSMNVGRGFISKELWRKVGDLWFLAEDDFTVEEQY